MSEINVLMPEPQRLTLRSGLVVELQEFSLRQFLAIMRVVTSGTPAEMLPGLLAGLASEDRAEQFGQQAITAVLMSMTNAEDEVIEFVASMVRPVGLIRKPNSKLSKAEREINSELHYAVAVQLDNPCMEDAATLLPPIITSIASSMRELGKKLAPMFQVWMKMGAPESSTQTSVTDISSEE